MSTNRVLEFARLNRRGFLAMAGAAIAGMRCPAIAPGNSPRLAFLAAAGRIESYAIKGSVWKLQHSVSSEAPVSLAVNSSGSALYAVHDVREFESLPRGYVESYRIETDSARLTLLDRQPLSLSAIGPRHIAIAPDGKSLIASIHGGGAYNLLPILPDGSAGRVRAIRKMTGHGLCAGRQASAHPQAVVHDRTAPLVLAADLGADTLDILDADSLVVLARRALPPGSGPSRLALHSSQRFALVACALSGTLMCVEYLHASAQFGDVWHSLPGTFGGPLAFDPSGHILYAACANGMMALRVEEQSGALHPVDHIQFPSGVMALAISPARDRLFAATAQKVHSIRIGSAGGRFGQMETAVDSPGIQSIILA